MTLIMDMTNSEIASEMNKITRSEEEAQMTTISFQEASELAKIADGAFSFISGRRFTVQFHYSKGTVRQSPEYIAPYNFFGFVGR